MEPLPESVNPDWPLPFVPQDWEHTPAAVQAYVHTLQDELTHCARGWKRWRRASPRIPRRPIGHRHQTRRTRSLANVPPPRPGKRVGNRAIRAIARHLYLPRRSTSCAPNGARVATRRLP